MRKIILLIVSMIMLVSLAGCAFIGSEEVVESSKSKIVRVETIVSESYPNELYYLGTAMPEDSKKLSMKNSGIIDTIFVEVGDYIGVGDSLIMLDDVQLGLAVSNSSEQVNTARLDYEKSVESYDYYKDSYDDALALYNAGAVSESELDQIELQREISEKEMDQALSLYKQSQVGYSNSAIQKDDSLLVAEMSGYVMEVLNEEGELYAAGYPAIIVRSENQVINVGMGQEDIRKIDIGTGVYVEVEDLKIQGKVNKINAIPDETTRTYNVEIAMDSEEILLIGEVCDTYFNLGYTEGHWINISTINSDGMNYVYVVEDDRVVRKNIELYEIYEDRVRVEGLDDGDLLITEGGKNLKIGYKVFVEGDESE